jgi:hypothetical protein
MEAGWISVPVDGRAQLFSVLARVKVWCGGAQVVTAASSPIKSPRLQPHLDDVGKPVGVVWFSRTSSGSGVLRGAS